LLRLITIVVAVTTPAAVAVPTATIATTAITAAAITMRITAISRACRSMVLEAVAAVDRAILARDEWDRGGAPAVGADRLVALAALGTLAEAAALGITTGRAALWTAAGIVSKAAAGIKFLLTSGKGESLPTLAAGEDTIVVSCIVRHEEIVPSLYSLRQNSYYFV
jgi:hypothetical protein